MNNTKVVNLIKDEFDVYIGRGSKFGNPYTHIKNKNTKADYIVDSRADSINMYEKWLDNQIKNEQITKHDILELDGKRLGCYCKPKSCHGDILVKKIDELMAEQKLFDMFGK